MELSIPQSLLHKVTKERKRKASLYKKKRGADSVTTNVSKLAKPKSKSVKLKRRNRPVLQNFYRQKEEEDDEDVEQDGTISIEIQETAKDEDVNSKKRGVLVSEMSDKVFEEVNSEEDLDQYSVSALKSFCEAYDLPKSGARKVIVKRVLRYIMDNKDEPDYPDEDLDEPAVEEEEEEE